MTSAAFPDLVADLLRQGCEVRFRAEGDSMAPAIISGDTVILRPVRLAQVRPGDVLACRRQSRLFLHRLVAISEAGGETWLHLRGDAKRGLDAPLPLTAVIGRVAAVERPIEHRDRHTLAAIGRQTRSHLARAARTWLAGGSDHRAA